MAANFSRRVFEQQPWRVASAISKDAVKLFALQRVTSPGDTSVTRWQFQRAFPLYPPYITDAHGHLRFAQLNPAGKVKVIAKGRRYRDQPAVSAGLAGFLRAYQVGGGYTPGPLFLVTLLAGLAGSIGVLRRRASPAQRATATACVLDVPQRGRGPARVGCVRVQLAVPAAGPGHVAAGGGTGHHGGRRLCRGPAAGHAAGSRPGRRVRVRAPGGAPRIPAEGPGVRRLSCTTPGLRHTGPAPHRAAPGGEAGLTQDPASRAWARTGPRQATRPGPAGPAARPGAARACRS